MANDQIKFDSGTYDRVKNCSTNNGDVLVEGLSSGMGVRKIGADFDIGTDGAWAPFKAFQTSCRTWAGALNTTAKECKGDWGEYVDDVKAVETTLKDHADLAAADASAIKDLAKLTGTPQTPTPPV